MTYSYDNNKNLKHLYNSFAKFLIFKANRFISGWSTQKPLSSLNSFNLINASTLLDFDCSNHFGSAMHLCNLLGNSDSILVIFSAFLLPWILPSKWGNPFLQRASLCSAQLRAVLLNWISWSQFSLFRHPHSGAGHWYPKRIGLGRTRLW